MFAGRQDLKNSGSQDVSMGSSYITHSTYPGGSVSRFCARTTLSIICPPFTESPFARSRRYPLRCVLIGHMGRHYPSVIATSNSCARPKSSPGLGLPLYQESLQVCDESLLEVGPSRRYLYESFSTCLDPYPGCSCGAFTRFFPQDFGSFRIKLT